MLNFTGALFGVRQHGGVGSGGILQLPIPRSSFSSIKTQSRVGRPPRASPGERYTNPCNPRSTLGLVKTTSLRGVKPGGRGNPESSV